MMARKRSSISKARKYEEMGEFWDTHDLTDYWEKTKPVEFTVDIKSETIYYSVESSFDRKIQDVAKNHGVSSETLLNLWVQEKLQKEAT